MARARIFRPEKTAMQSGSRHGRHWVLEYEPVTPRLPDPLMGWASAGDTLNEVRLKFDSLENAVAYAQRRRIEYEIIAPEERQVKPKSYADNFRYNRVRF
jgi:hypothetical protein